MVKQIALETLYDAKQHKGKVIKEIAIFAIFLVCTVCCVPHRCFFSLLALVHIKKWDSERTYMSEVTGFLPMSQKEKRNYISIKSYTAAIGYGILLFLAYVYIVVCSGAYICDEIFWWNSCCQVISFSLYVYLLTLSVECAKWRRMKADMSMQLLVNVKSVVLYVVFILMLISIFWWCSMNTFRDVREDVSATTLSIQKVITCLFLVIQYISCRSLKNTAIKELIYSDYNAKIARNEEVDYEY